jgi:hypothetical protein
VTFSGYTARTPFGPVDIVPFLRRLEGHPDQPILRDERDAGILALRAAGIESWRIANALNMSVTSVEGVLRQKPKRSAIPTSRSDKYDRWRAAMDRRRAERVLIDGRLVHPRCVHGKNSSYTGYGCQCEPCSEAHTVARRKSYKRKGVAV